MKKNGCQEQRREEQRRREKNTLRDPNECYGEDIDVCWMSAMGKILMCVVCCEKDISKSNNSTNSDRYCITSKNKSVL